MILLFAFIRIYSHLFDIRYSIFDIRYSIFDIRKNYPANLTESHKFLFVRIQWLGLLVTAELLTTQFQPKLLTTQFQPNLRMDDMWRPIALKLDQHEFNSPIHTAPKPCDCGDSSLRVSIPGRRAVGHRRLSHEGRL
jgi:hypothetical protein